MSKNDINKTWWNIIRTQKSNIQFLGLKKIYKNIYNTIQTKIEKELIRDTSFMKVDRLKWRKLSWNVTNILGIFI